HHRDRPCVPTRRSSDLSTGEFKEISFVNGMGNTNNAHSYSFQDKNLQTGNYSYRLKQVDLNGNYKYYELANEVTVGVPKQFSLRSEEHTSELQSRFDIV